MSKHFPLLDRVRIRHAGSTSNRALPGYSAMVFTAKVGNRSGDVRKMLNVCCEYGPAVHCIPQNLLRLLIQQLAVANCCVVE